MTSLPACLVAGTLALATILALVSGPSSDVVTGRSRRTTLSWRGVLRRIHTPAGIETPADQIPLFDRRRTSIALACRTCVSVLLDPLGPAVPVMVAVLTDTQTIAVVTPVTITVTIDGDAPRTDRHVGLGQRDGPVGSNERTGGSRERPEAERC